MKVFKSSQFPNVNVFLKACQEYRQYYTDRQTGKLRVARPFPSEVCQYSHLVFKAERLKEKAPLPEFISFTEREWWKLERQRKDKRKLEKLTRQRDSRQSENRVSDREKAASDPEFKKLLIWQALQDAGIGLEEIVHQIAAERYDGIRSQEFVLKRKKVIDQVEDEIKEVSEE